MPGGFKFKQGLLLTFMAGVFVADTITALEIAIAVFYVIPILMAVSLMDRRGVIAVILMATLLTILSFPLSSAGAADSGLINLLISVCAIASTGWLALQADAAQKKMQIARSQAAHMARVTALGELSASIAHEVNQPLAAIITSSDACKRWLNNDPPNRAKALDAMKRIGADAHRASEIVKRVRRLASPTPPDTEHCELGHSIEETVALLRPQLRASQIHLSYEKVSRPLMVLADPVQLQQVLLNLLINAIEALAERAPPDRRIRLRSYTDELSACVSIEDNGIGLTTNDQHQLFEAFYSTKRGGMGIGLAITRSIVETLGGQIRAESNAAGGATFFLTLPLTAENE